MKISKLLLVLVIFSGLTFQAKSVTKITNNTGHNLLIQRFDEKGEPLVGGRARPFFDDSTEEVHDGGHALLYDIELTHVNRSPVD